MGNKAKRLLYTSITAALIILIGIVSSQYGWEGGVSYLIGGVLIIIISYIFSRFSTQCDWEERFIYGADDYEPNLWSINGILIGTRLIKSKSNPYVVYTFLYFMYIPLLPIRCHAYTVEEDQYNQGEMATYWCGARWNIMDLATIYFRWYAFILIFIGLVRLFS